MRKLIMLAMTGTLVLAGGLAWAQKARVSPLRPIPAIQSLSPPQKPRPFTTISGMTASPTTIQFTANDPGSTVAGNSSATVKYSLTNGVFGTWTLSVYASSTTFTGCSTVPATAVSVECSSATANSGTFSSASCSATSYTSLPTTAPGLQVASGSEGFGSSSYTVVLNYELSDSWEYIANTCPLTITYTVNAP